MEEIWAYGLRNPWRFSFDPDQGDLYIGDPGTSLYEEIDYQAAGTSGGLDFGWSLLEGSHCPPYNDGCNADSIAGANSLTPPIFEYPRAPGPLSICGAAVIGEYVYRGAAITELQGKYIFADYCYPKFMALSVGGETAGMAEDITEALGLPTAPPVYPTSFGRDADGELYIVDQGQDRVFKIVPR